MCIINKLNKPFLIQMDIITIFAISILHIVISVMRKQPDFNTYELFNSSPFFDFSIGDDCYDKTSIVFHTWGGWKNYEYDDTHKDYRFKTVDLTNITKIHGNYFCYKYISYIDLLNNGQIIKQGTECPKEYNKNCGKVDTLNQELCIKEDEKCPLYDVGIGTPPIYDKYIHHKGSNIYYNKDNYDEPNKTIIGKLILNDGQPCYQPSEKLWRSFAVIESEQTHLYCENIQINGSGSDNRFEEKGNISYKKIYEDNLEISVKNYIIGNITRNLTVSLYKREIAGIDKKCDEKLNMFDNFDDFKKIQSKDKTIQQAEGIVVFLGCFIFGIFEFIYCCEKYRIVPPKVHFAFFIIYTVAICGFFSYHVVSYVNMLKSDYSYYNCSDSITNEIIKIGNENNKNIAIYNKIATFTDASIIGVHIIVLLIGFIWDRIDKCLGKDEYKECNDTKGKDNDINRNDQECETPYYELTKK